MRFRRTLGALCASAALLAPLTASAQSAMVEPADKWTFSIMPYLWLPGVSGKLNYGPPAVGGGSANVDIDASKLLDSLNFAAMINGQARYGRWLVATDVIYLDFGKQDSTVKSVDLNPGTGPINISTSNIDAGTQSSLSGWVWTAVGGYGLVMEPRWNLDLIGGFRLLSLDAQTDWQLAATVTGTGPGGASATFARTGSISASQSIWAGIIGAKGRAKLGESDWFVNYYVDVGGNSDTFTWQGAGGIGYAFRWGDVVLDYRYLYYSQSSGKLIDNVAFGGLALGVNFRF